MAVHTAAPTASLRVQHALSPHTCLTAPHTCPICPSPHLCPPHLSDSPTHLSDCRTHLTAALTCLTAPHLPTAPRTCLICLNPSGCTLAKMAHSGRARIWKATAQWWFSSGEMSL